MGFWIEVRSGMRWVRLRRSGVVLKSPNTARYRSFFEGMHPDDLVLHYLTTALTWDKHVQSTVVGTSRIDSSPLIGAGNISAPCTDTIEFPHPVRYPELRKLRLKPGPLENLIGMRMQRYLTKIKRSEFRAVLETEPTNLLAFKRSPLNRILSRNAAEDTVDMVQE